MMPVSAVTPSLVPAATPVQNWNWLARLAEEGWAVVNTMVPDTLARVLLTEARAKHESDLLERAGIGRVDGHAIDSAIRRDKTLWFDRSTPAQSAYLDIMETLRLEVNKELYLGLFSFETHFAAYEPGGFYKRHVDAFKGAKNRMLSTVFYLNPDWVEGDGGELVIYNEDIDSPKELGRIAPELGTFLVFLSEDIPHEVLPTRNDRYSIAGWFRVNDRQTAPSLQAPSSVVMDF